MKQEVPGFRKGLVRVSSAAVDELACEAAATGKMTESTTTELFGVDILAGSPGKASVEAWGVRVAGATDSDAAEDVKMPGS